MIYPHKITAVSKLYEIWCIFSSNFFLKVVKNLSWVSWTISTLLYQMSCMVTVECKFFQSQQNCYDIAVEFTATFIEKNTNGNRPLKNSNTRMSVCMPSTPTYSEVMCKWPKWALSSVFFLYLPIGDQSNVFPHKLLKELTDQTRINPQRVCYSLISLYNIKFITTDKEISSSWLLAEGIELLGLLHQKLFSVPSV